MDVPNELIIDTPLGECKLNSKDLKDFVLDTWKAREEIMGDDSTTLAFANYIDVPPGDLMSNLEEIMAKEFPTTMECFSRYLKIHYDQEEIYNIKFNSSVRIAPSYTDFILRGIKYTVPFRAIMNLKHKETGEKIVIWCIPFDGNNCDIKIHYEGTREDSVGASLWTDFMDFFWKESLLVGQCFYADYTLLDRANFTWDDIIMSDEHRNEITRNISDFFTHFEVFKKHGIKLSRGVILNGPPGTGKTLTCNIIKSQLLDITTIVVTRDHIQEIGDISNIYKMAQKMAPALVIVEDLDTIGGISRGNGDHPLLGEFLNALSGIESNKGVATLATTNHADKLDWALIDRPGRFDCRIELGYPNATIRKEILKKYLQPLPHKNDLDLIYVVRKTEQMSGAYLEELIRLAFQNALSEVDYKADKAFITNEDLEYATELLLKQRSRTIKDMERNNLIIPNVEDDEDWNHEEDFYQ